MYTKQIQIKQEIQKGVEFYTNRFTRWRHKGKPAPSKGILLQFQKIKCTDIKRMGLVLLLSSFFVPK